MRYNNTRRTINKKYNIKQSLETMKKVVSMNNISIEQNGVINKIKENYFNIIEDGFGIENYKDLLKILNRDFGLTEDETKTFQRR